MHIKHQNNRGSWWLPGFPVAAADSEQCFLALLFLGAVCRQAVLAQGARPSQPGHVLASRRGVGWVEETLLNRCVVPELDPRLASSPRSDASASSRSSALSPPGGSLRLVDDGVEAKKMENQEAGGDYQT